MIVIFDLDGTLADIKHRRHYVENGNHNWDKFYETCVNDTPNMPIVEICRRLKGSGLEIAIFSGRSDVVKKETEDWLSNNHIEYDFLYMRPQGDYTSDHILKKKWLDEFEKKRMIMCVFDDRDRIVNMWRNEGYVCLQVAEGDF